MRCGYSQAVSQNDQHLITKANAYKIRQLPRKQVTRALFIAFYQKLLAFSWIFLIFKLVLLIGCQSIPNRLYHKKDQMVQQGNGKSRRTLHLVFLADLRARQQGATQKIPVLIKQVNALINPLGIDLKLEELREWQTNGEDNLDSLYRTLKEKAEKEGIASDTIWVGFSATDPPSNASTDQLVQSRYAQPLLMMRDLYLYYPKYQEEGEVDYQLGQRNLLLLALGQIFGAIPSCDLDWMSFSKNQLLGMKLSAFYYQRPLGTPSRNPRNIDSGMETFTSPDSDQLNDQLSKARRVKAWSAVNQQLISIHTQLPLSLNPQLSSFITSESIKAIHQFDRCESHMPRLELLYAIRYQNEEALLEDAQKDLLSGQAFLDEYAKIARGLQALQAQKAELAFQTCQSIAQKKPSTLASKCAGLAAVSLNKTEEAIQFLRAYLGVNPRDELVLLSLAKQVGKTGDDQSALALLFNCLEVNPQNTLALLNVGIAYIRLQRYAEAIDVLKKIPADAKEYGNAEGLLKQIDMLK